MIGMGLGQVAAAGSERGVEKILNLKSSRKRSVGLGLGGVQEGHIIATRERPSS